MKKIVIFILFLGFFANLLAAEFTFNLSERNISVQNDNGIAKFDWSNAVSVDVPGDPALPVYVVDFILPDDADMDSVSVDIINDSADVLTGNFDVLPTAPIEPENSERYWPEHPENIDEHGRNRLIYGGNGINAYNGFLHNSWIEKVVKNKWKSVKFVKVFVRAYDWNPATKELKKLISGTLRVSVASSNNTITLSHFSPITALNLGFLMQNTVNNDFVRIQNIIPTGISNDFQPLYYFMQGQIAFNVLTATEIEPTLYIITTEEIRSKSKLFRYFVKSKRHRGFAVHIVTEYKTTVYRRNGFLGGEIFHVGWEDNSDVTTRADKIRNYLKHNNRYEEIDYLLLIGNPHPGSCQAAPQFNDPANMNNQNDCIYDGTNEGDIPMKWVNLDAYSKIADYCKDYDNNQLCNSWMEKNDLRRAYPSDIYYSALSKDWDSNNNGLIGDTKEEIGVISNDVILGRIPVYNNNIDDLDKYFQKVIRYENTLKTYVPPTINNVQNTNRDTIETLRHKVFALANYMDNHRDRDETPNWIFAEYLNNLPVNHSFNFDFMFRNDDLINWYYPIALDAWCEDKGNFKRRQTSPNPNEECRVNKYYSNFFNNLNISNLIVNNPGNSGWSANRATNEWRYGKYGIVLWSSHGGRDRAVIANNNIATLEDYYPVHTFQASCQTGWPEDPNNLATSLLRHGAVTTIAASRNSWGYSTEFENGVFQLVSDESRQRSSQEIALLYLKRFLLNDSAGSSFARAIEEFSAENYYKHNEIIFNLYGDPTLGITSWRESEEDSDHDGIIDEFDNCPDIPNPDQKDDDLDFVGNECDSCQGNYNPGAYDSDKDGIPNECDNCPNHYNPSQIDSDWDGIADACDNCPNHYNSGQEDTDGDKVGNACDNCPNKKNPREINNSEIVAAICERCSEISCPFIGGARCMQDTYQNVYKDRDGNWLWQPDHNLNGKGDACERKELMNLPELVDWAEFAGIPQGNSVNEGIIAQESGHEVVSMRRNETLSVKIKIESTDSTDRKETATTRYCWATSEDLDMGRWGSKGYCTTEAGYKEGACDTNFGYSHGTDPQPIAYQNIPSWKSFKDKNNSTESYEFTQIKVGEIETITWDWRHDFKIDNPWYAGASLDAAPQCQTLPALGFCRDRDVTKFYYTMSTGVHSGDDEADYIINGNQINPAFFKNDKKYTRSQRLTLNPVAITYHTEPVTHFYPYESCTGNCGFRMEEWHDMLIDMLIHGPRPYEMTMMEHYFKNDYGSDLINSGVSFREWSNTATGMPSVVEKNSPMNLLTITKNASGMNEGILAVQNNTLLSLRDIQEPTSSNFTFEIVTMDANSNGDWRTKGILDVTGTQNFMPTTSVHHDGSLYVVNYEGRNDAYIYRIDKTDQTVMPENGYNFCFHIIPIYIPIHEWTLTDLTNITLHSVGNNLLALGKTSSGMKVYKLSEQNGNPYFKDISGAILPGERDVYNVEVKDGVLYLAGGALLSESEVHFTNDIWSFTETDGWQLIRNDINMFPVTLRIDFDGDNIILTDRVIRPNGTTNRAIFAADGTGDIVIETVPVEGANVQGFGDYCLKETGTALQGGIETSGECVPFTHPWYNSFSAGATVYSLAGKGNRLYVGTNNAIKVYDISDPTSPVLVSSFSTSSRVNDLEVYGNALFAATNGGLYKLDASNDTLTQTLFVSAFLNSQYKVEVYNGKLYVGDDNGIKVRDLDTMSVLTSVNNGSVLDFAIENGEIGLYKDALFSPVEVRDADTLTLKANEFFGCFEIEVGSSFGRFYLSCDDETYRFEDDGDGDISFTELSGDIRELQDIYTYNGYTYFYDENTIWISTSSDVPAICGNGIVEGDEVCDGGQIDCEELDSNYVSGTATCNSTCDGYNTNNCSDDGW